MPNPFDEAEKQLNSSPGKSGQSAGSVFDQAESELGSTGKKQRMGGMANTLEALKHTAMGLNPIPMFNLAGAAVTSWMPGQFGDNSRQILKSAFVDPSVEQLGMAKQQFDAGDYGQAIARTAAAIPVAGPAVVHAFDEYDKTGNWGAPVGDVASAVLMNKAVPIVKAGLKKVGRSVYETALNPSASTSLADREAMVTRGLRPGSTMSVTPKSLIDLGLDSKMFKDQVNYLTKDSSSVFSQRTVPIDTVLAPLDQWIQMLGVKPDLQLKAMKLRDTWAQKLGYQPAQRVPVVGTGNPVTPQQAMAGVSPAQQMTTIPAQTHATVADIQLLKEDLNSLVKSSSYGVKAKGIDAGPEAVTDKVALGGMQKAVEGQVTNIKNLNRAIHVDLMLKDAISSAIRRQPSWVKDWAVFVMGTGAAEMLTTQGAQGAPVIVGGLIRTALRNPETMSRLAIGLHNAGVKLPAGLQKFAVPVAGANIIKGNKSSGQSGQIPEIPQDLLPK